MAESQPAGTTEPSLEDAKDRWMAVLEASYLERLLRDEPALTSAAASARESA